VISRSALAQRLGVETSEIAVGLEGLASGKPVISAADVLRDIAENMTDTEIMRKYKLSRKGLQSLLRKLYQRGLISKVTLLRRKGLSK
jgi:transcription initiation factor IIE alpha subunit